MKTAKEILGKNLKYCTPMCDGWDEVIESVLETMEQYASEQCRKQLTEDLLEGHDINMLLAKCKQLKWTDGEGWAIGNFIENILNPKL